MGRDLSVIAELQVAEILIEKPDRLHRLLKKIGGTHSVYLETNNIRTGSTINMKLIL